MNTESAIWASFVPRHMLSELNTAPTDLPDAERRLDVVALFADVSGFTAMSEALGRAGRQGTEELTAVLNSYFDPMIALIESYGGVIGKFGGDALTVLFPYTAGEYRITVRRAVQCALEMQADMPRYAAIQTSAGMFGLAMKAGLARGRLLSLVAGEPEIRLEYLLAGAVLDRCADAEHHATKGEVVVHDDLLDALDDATIVERRSGFTCLSALAAPPERAPLDPPTDLSPTALRRITRYVHPAMVERLERGQTGFINEHRKVTVLFVSFSGFDYDGDSQVGGKLRRYVADVVQTVQRYDGYLNKVDMGDKGSKLIVLFGAPISHEDDEERALRCALDLRDLPGSVTRIGVNTGSVYAGLVGSSARQEYTVMGDPVNLAARLMQASRPGQILLSAVTRKAAGEGFNWEDLPPIMVKGKTEPIAICAVQDVGRRAALSEPEYALPMIGRARELQAAWATIDSVMDGQGRILAIIADAGMGKSRLASEVIRLAAVRGFTCLAGAGQSYGVQSSYLIWQPIWRGFFGLDDAMSPAEQIQAIETVLAALAPRLARRLPLLGPVLNLSIPDNDLTAALEPQLRAELLTSLLLECLRARATAPLLILLEDCHWIDARSDELLEAVARSSIDLPVLLVVVSRPPEEGALQGVLSLRTAQQLHLGEIEADEARELIRLKLAQRFGLEDEPPETLVRRITERAEGNPFYIEEIVNFLHDRNIDPGNSSELEGLELPGSLHSLILSRIDRLGEREQTTLKVAGVIGRVFRAPWIWGSYPPVGTPPEVLAHLRTLERVDLTPLDQPGPEPVYLFKHITTREVAYESLAYATRSLLHEQVATYIEARYADQIDQYLDLLAYHYGNSPNVERQRVYFRRAGDAARAAFANTAAVDYYRRLAGLLEGAELAETLRRLGEVIQLIGEWGEAEALYVRAAETAAAAHDPHGAALAQGALGRMLAFTERTDEARTALEQAEAALMAQGDRTGIGALLESLSFIAQEQGDNDRALHYAERRLELAQAAGDQVGISAAFAALGPVSWSRGDIRQALEYLQRAVQIARACGYREGVIIAANDMAGVYNDQNDYAAALDWLRQALEVAVEIGFQHAIGVMVGNAGELYRQRGAFGQALGCFAHALRITRSMGVTPALLNNLARVAAVYAAQERTDEAARLFAYALRDGRTQLTPFNYCVWSHEYAILLTMRGEWEAARAANNEARILAGEIGRQETAWKAELLEVQLDLAEGRLDSSAAQDRWEAFRQAWPDDEAQAALAYARWRSEPQHPGARLAAIEQYRALYGQSFDAEDRRRLQLLGVTDLPEPPPLPDILAVLGERPPELAPLIERVLGG